MISVPMANERTVLTMTEYIEREALMRRIKEIHCAECDSYHGVRCRACWVDDTLDYIDSEQAADVAPVVRCKDCKYWQDNNDGYPHEECRWVHEETPDADDFCSYGERKEGDK